ncbi:MAG TPA: type II toxin-antitoxin system RelE/ParE family toxin [Candidatus Binatia bacterium]|nr:type II toxin-antitoxin system RelE/ParE family toxin [Candidatus Binatia bacterium]
MERTIVIYETTDGKCPFLDWLNGLKDIKARAAVRSRLDRVRLGNLGDSKNIGDGAHELRIPFGPGYRVYFGQDGLILVVLLCGGDKRSQKRDIAKAKTLWREYHANKKLPK